MNLVQKGLAAAGFAAMGSVATAQPADFESAALPIEKVVGHTSMNYQIYNTQEYINGDRTTTRGRVLVDKVLGISCEWTEHGRREADDNAEFHTVDVKAKQVGCIPTTDVPKKWQQESVDFSPEKMAFMFMQRGANPRQAQEAAKQQYEAAKQSVGEVFSSTSNPFQLVEVVTEGNPHALPGLQIRHKWNLATNEVCLDTLEIKRSKENEMEAINRFDWGCRPITNQKYFDRVLATRGIKPA
jgi:hypothetical protein